MCSCTDGNKIARASRQSNVVRLLLLLRVRMCARTRAFTHRWEIWWVFYSIWKHQTLLLLIPKHCIKLRLGNIQTRDWLSQKRKSRLKHIHKMYYKWLVLNEPTSRISIYKYFLSFYGWFLLSFSWPKKNINLDQQQEHVKANSCMSWLIINVYNKWSSHALGWCKWKNVFLFEKKKYKWFEEIKGFFRANFVKHNRFLKCLE